MPDGRGWWASSPRSSNAVSSAVARASVLIRQDSTSFSPSKQPMTVLVLPTSMVSSMVQPLASWGRLRSWGGPQVDADVEHRCGVRECADGQVVDAGRGHCGGAVERQSAGRLQLGPTVDHGDGLAQVVDAHVVEQQEPRAGVDRLAHLLDRVALDLYVDVGEELTDRPEGGSDTTGRQDVVVVDQRRVVQTHPLVGAAATADGVLLQRAQPRVGLARV